MSAKKQRQEITEKAKLQVVSLYKDEYSRMLPNAKDKVSVGRGHYHQKFMYHQRVVSCI